MFEFVENVQAPGGYLGKETTRHTIWRGPATPPVTDIRVCLHGLIAHDPISLQGPELWAYQLTVFELGRQFQLTGHADKKDLNWSMPNICLYNEVFTGRAKSIPRCLPLSLRGTRGAQCPHNPNPLVLGWFPDPQPLPLPLGSYTTIPNTSPCRRFPL